MTATLSAHEMLRTEEEEFFRFLLMFCTFLLQSRESLSLLFGFVQCHHHRGKASQRESRGSACTFTQFFLNTMQQVTKGIQPQGQQALTHRLTRDREQGSKRTNGFQLCGQGDCRWREVLANQLQKTDQLQMRTAQGGWASSFSLGGFGSRDFTREVF